MKNKIIILFAILLVTALNSCNSLHKTGEKGQPDILSGQWEMYKWKSVDSLKSLFPTGIPNFTIDTEKGTIKAFKGCNQLYGKLRYSPHNASIQFYAITSDRIFCKTDAELDLTNNLARVDKYMVDENKLSLMVNNEVIMELNRIAD